MKQFGAFEEIQVAKHIKQVLEAIHYIHENDYIC